MNKYDCLIVANGSEAKVFKYQEQGQALEQIYAVANATRRDQNKDLVTDRPGVMSGGGSNIQGKSALSNEESPLDKAKEDFAQTVVEWVEEARKKDEVNSVDIVASPEILGLMRDKMSSQLQKIIDRTVDKDAVGKDEKAILALVSEHH